MLLTQSAKQRTNATATTRSRQERPTIVHANAPLRHGGSTAGHVPRHPPQHCVNRSCESSANTVLPPYLVQRLVHAAVIPPDGGVEDVVRELKRVHQRDGVRTNGLQCATQGLIQQLQLQRVRTSHDTRGHTHTHARIHIQSYDALCGQQETYCTCAAASAERQPTSPPITLPEPASSGRPSRLRCR